MTLMVGGCQTQNTEKKQFTVHTHVVCIMLRGDEMYGVNSMVQRNLIEICFN